MKFIPAVLWFILLLNAGQEKPEYVPYGDYSFLDGQPKKVLLVLNLTMDTLEKDEEASLVAFINEWIQNRSFALSYRRYLARKLHTLDPEGTLIIDFDQNAHSKNTLLKQYMLTKNYPDSVLKNYDLVLEIQVYALLMFEMSYLNLIKRERMELWDIKKSKKYLSSLNSYTYQSIGEKIHLKKHKKYTIQLIHHYLHRSLKILAEHLLNKTQPPNIEDITPALPELAND